MYEEKSVEVRTFKVLVCFPPEVPINSKNQTPFIAVFTLVTGLKSLEYQNKIKNYNY